MNLVFTTENLQKLYNNAENLKKIRNRKKKSRKIQVMEIKAYSL